MKLTPQLATALSSYREASNNSTGQHQLDQALLDFIAHQHVRQLSAAADNAMSPINQQGLRAAASYLLKDISA